MISQFDIQFLNTDDVGQVPFIYNGKCTGHRTIAQKVLVLLFTDPSSRGYGGGLDPKKIFTTVDPESQIRGAVADIKATLEEEYPGVRINVVFVERGRGSLAMTLEIETEGITETITTTLPA